MVRPARPRAGAVSPAPGAQYSREISVPAYGVPVTVLHVPGSSPVTRSPRPAWVPVTTLPLMVSDTPNLGASGRGAVPQNALTWPAGRYSLPVTRLQLPASLPVTLVLRPTSVPVTGRPAAVFVSDTLLGLGTMSVWQNSRKISAARYSVPVMTRQLLSSSPVRRWPRPTCVPVTVWPWAV